MIQINPLKSYIDGGVRAAITTPPSASLVFDLPGKAIWVKGVKLKGTDHTYTFSHDNYITLTNTSNSNESEDIKIGVNTSALKNAIDTTYGVVSTTTNGLAPKFTSENKLAATTATTYYFLGWTGSTLKWYQAPFRNVRINSETIDRLGVNNTDPLIISSGNGISVTWDSTNKKIVITNTKPDVNHNTHYTTMLYIGENNDTKANKNVANPYLKLFDDNTRRATFQIKAGSGIAVTSDANGNITITNSSPDVNHNTDRTGIKLATVSGTKKTDSTLILANSATGLSIQGGTNKFLIGDGTNYIEVPVTPSFTVSNKDATIGTTLTTIATIAGVDIKAKIASYSLSNHTHSITINGSTKTITTSGTVDLGNYLPLSGGTMNGTAWIKWPDSGNWNNSNSGVTFPVIRGGLQWSGLSDYIKLFTEETSNDNLNLILQFGDDNSNGLSIRDKSNVQTSHISAGGVITTGTFKGNLDWSYITNKPSSYTPSAHTHAWNSLTHSSTTENQAILTNGSANGWKLYTLNISGWNNAANNAHSHSNKSVLDGITSTLVNNWNTAYNFVNTISGTDTDKVINKWDEIVNFLAGISEDDKLNTLLNNKLSVYKLADNTNVGTIKNNGIYYSTTDASSDTLTNSPFNTGFALINMTSYDGGDDLRRSRLAFNAYGEIKISDDRDLANTAETWYNVLTSKNSGISGSTIKLNGTSITVYSSSTADGRYVKKTGDTMSGALTIDTIGFGALTIKRNDDANGASIQFRGKSNVYGYIGLNNSTKDKLFLRWSSDTSKTYIILDTSSTYVSSGKGIINGTTITQVDNAINSTNSTNAHKLVNWYSTRPTSLNTQFGDGSLRIFHATSSTTEGKSPDDATILHLSWDNNGGWDSQLGISAPSGRIYSRAQNKGTWQSWKTLAFTTDIPTSLKNPYALTISLNGTSLGPYDGSATKNINITPSSIGAATSGHNHDDRYYTKAESNAKYITDITTSINKLTFTKNGSNINKDITVNVVYSLGNLTNISDKDNTTKASSGLFIYNSYNLVIGTNSYSSVLSINTGGTIQIAGNWGDDLTRNLYWRSLSDRAVSSYPWKSWRTILDNENYSSILDSRYYTESEVNNLLSNKLNISDFNWTNLPGKLVAGNEFNIVNAGFNAGMWFNYVPINDRSKTATITGYHFGNGATGYTSIIASGFVKNGSSSSYVLLGDGGHKAISDFATSRHTHSIYAANENYGGFTKSGRLPISGFYQSAESESGGNAPWSGWMHLINCLHSNTGNNYALLIAASFSNNNTFKIRVTNNNVNNAWRDIIHSGNIGSQSVASATRLQTARNLWGNSFNGTADINGTIRFNNVTSGLCEGILWTCGDNDFARIKAGATGSDAGYLEIATADGGSEPIYVRQYSGVFNTIVRTLTLLDGSGNTIFPGTVTATTFNGNASSTTKLQTTRTLWGQPFNGTTNVSGSISGTYFHIEDRASNPYFLFIDSSNQIGYFQLLSQNKGVAIGSTESKSLIVNPSGNVSIGTNSPSYKLHVAGDIYTTTGFKKNGSSNSYVLLGGGGHKLENNLSVAYSKYLIGITLTGGNNNDSGYRLIFEKTMGAWDLNYGVWAIAFRHSGRGILNIGFDTTNSDGSTYTYNIRFFGSTTARESTPFRAFYNTTTKVFRIYWHYYDYTSGNISVLRGNIEPYNGAWITSLPDNVGTELTITCNTADLATNSDTINGYHASDLVKFYLSPLDNGASASSAKSWFTNTMPSASGAIVYNVPGSEKTIIAGKSSGAYGHMLQLNYDDNYLRILRYYGGSWKTSDWEKISAGYADNSGNASSATKSTYSRSLLGRNTSGSDYDASAGNLVFAEWNTKSDNRWYLKATGYECRVNYATSAGNADTVDGLHVHGGKNNEANKIVRTDENGFILAGWINTTSGDMGTTAATRVYCSNDAYIRYKTISNFRTDLVSGLYWANIKISTSSSTSTNPTFASLFINTGDSTLKVYNGKITDAKSDGNICLQTSIDGTDGLSHVYPTQYGARCTLVLLPRGGLVYIGTNPDGGNTAYKLYVNGGAYASLFIGNNIEATDSNGMIAYKPSAWTGVSNAQFGIGTIATETIIRSNNTSLKHYRHGSGTYTIWDSGNDGSGSGLDADIVDGYHANKIYNAPTFILNNPNTSNTYILLATITISGTSLAMAEFTILFQNRECLDSSSFILSGAIRRNSTTSVNASLSYITLHTETPRNIYLRSNDGITFMVYILSAASAWTTYYRAIPIVDSGNITYSNTGTTSPIGGSVLNITATKGGNVNYANSAGNADTIDGYHANGLLTALSNSNNGVSITVGGTTKSISNISVSYAQYLNSINRMDYGWNGINYFNASLTAGCAAKVNDSPTSNWWHILRFNHANSSGYYTDLAIPFNSNSLYWKTVRGGSVAYSSWIKVLDSLNYNEYAPTKTGGGASGTWRISITGNAATASKLGTSTVGATNIPIYLNGGTPTVVNLNSTANNLINNLTTGTSTPTDADYYISQYVGGGTTTTTYHRRPHSSLYSYIKGKAEGTWNISINGNANTVDGQHFNWNNNKNDHTYLWAASNNGNAYLVHRASISVNYANSAGNADTLDGNHASAFALVGHTHNYDNVYSKLGHTHDDRYYTESEINSKLSTYLPLAGGTMTGLIKGNNKGGSWILGRANAALYLPRNVQDDWHPVVGFKTKTGSWEFGSVGSDDFATFSWGSDSNYNSGTNTNIRVNLRASNGTIALTSEIPTVTNYYWANMKVSSTSSNNTSPTFSTCYTSNWFRSTGLTGWYNETYAGGWYMTDTTWVRTYNSKGIYINTGTIYNLGHVWLACNNGYNVGIGTTSPSYKLHVSGDSYTTGWSRAASGFYCQDTGVHFTHNGTKGQIAITSNNEFCWGANSNILYFNYAASSLGTTVTLYVWNAGSSSSYASHTMGHITLGNGSYLLKRVGSSSSWYNGRDKAIVRQTSNAGDYCVMMSSKTTSGSWEIGNEYDDLCFTYITDSNYNNRNNNDPLQIWFTYEGIIHTSNYILAAHFYENSDIRYKKILKNLSINSNTIANLPLFDFEWIENNSIGTGTSALAVLQILPNLVSGTDKLTLDYGVLGTIAGIIACKELVMLKSELLQLKEKVKLLEDKLRKYENI